MSLESLAGQFTGRRIVVVGDLIADLFVHGKISRVSREAPVLILSHQETLFAPGGAANAIHNLWAMGAIPLPIGFVGDDEAGQRLLEFFESRSIDTSGVRVLSGYATPTKSRILAGAAHAAHQQVLRIDRGTPMTEPVRIKAARILEKALGRRIRRADAVLVSDYGYGAVPAPLPEPIRAARIPVTIDSRFRLADHGGLTAATPNESEVEAALGIAIDGDPTRLEKAGRTLLRKLRHEAVLVTRGAKGMALFERGRRTEHIPIFGSDEVADVTGAGDTVIAAFTLALAAGGRLIDAARLANYAGGLAVMKHGTQPVPHAELLTALNGAARS